MSNNTTYSIIVNDEIVGTKSKKDRAIEVAEAQHAEDRTREVKVVTNAGTEVLVLEAKVPGAKPWTRTEDHELELEVPDGYTVAYTRNRVGALVARADDKSGWVVITADGVTEVANTKEAREVTNALATAHKERRAAELEAEKAEKAEAKAKREQERAEKAAAKAAEKEAKAKAKAEARAAKEAEAAAAEAEDLVSA